MEVVRSGDDEIIERRSGADEVIEGQNFLLLKDRDFDY